MRNWVLVQKKQLESFTKAERLFPHLSRYQAIKRYFIQRAREELLELEQADESEDLSEVTDVLFFATGLQMLIDTHGKGKPYDPTRLMDIMAAKIRSRRRGERSANTVATTV